MASTHTMSGIEDSIFSCLFDCDYPPDFELLHPLISNRANDYFSSWVMPLHVGVRFPECDRVSFFFCQVFFTNSNPNVRLPPHDPSCEVGWRLVRAEHRYVLLNSGSARLAQHLVIHELEFDRFAGRCFRWP